MSYYVRSYFGTYFYALFGGSGEVGNLRLLITSIPADDAYGHVTLDLGGDFGFGGCYPIRVFSSEDRKPEQQQPKLPRVTLYVDSSVEQEVYSSPTLRIPTGLIIQPESIPADVVSGDVELKSRMVWEDEELLLMLLAA